MIPKARMIELYDAKLVFKTEDMTHQDGLAALQVDELGFEFDDDRIIIYGYKSGTKRTYYYRGAFLVYR